MDSKTIMTGLFGHPVGHSLSPLMHNKAFEVCGLNYRYAAFDISPDEIGKAVEGIRALGFRGVNVTIPHKVAVMPYLDEIDEEAKIIGAVNTIVNEKGRLIGYNTDGRGYVRSLIEETGIQLETQSGLMIGAGGAARGVAVALLQTGLPELAIANRSRDKAQSLAEDLRKAIPGKKIEAISLGEIESTIGDRTLLVQTTSIGMSPHVTESPVSRDLLHKGLLVSDLIYNPLKTRIQKNAEEIGCRTHSGVGMFIYQGALSFEYWTGQAAPVEEMRQAVMHKLEMR